MNIKIYEDLANKGSNSRKLANDFLKDFYKNKEIKYPINPFEILKQLNIKFIFRDFSNAEGIYIPAENNKDFPIVGFNINRPIQRQRFTAAHELCHHLKDSHKNFICLSNSNNEIEKYADNFASELLMPIEDLKKQVYFYTKNGTITEVDILKISQYFGVSYEACLRKIVYEVSESKKLSYKTIKESIDAFKPNKQKRNLELFDTLLYEQLIESMHPTFDISYNNFSKDVFKNEYIFNDSRMEGIKIDREKASDIITDLRLNKQNSPFCNEKNQNIIELTGLSFMYDYIFEKSNTNISIYDAKHLNKLLYSTAPYPEYGGTYRETNTLVEGAKFETIDYTKIPEEFMNLGKTIDTLLNNSNISINEYIKETIKIHHRMTVIHPFRDGNGRTCRAFTNMLLIRKNIPPVFFSNNNKNEYKEALKIVDTKYNYDPLFEIFYKTIINSFTLLTDNIH